MGFHFLSSILDASFEVTEKRQHTHWAHYWRPADSHNRQYSTTHELKYYILEDVALRTHYTENSALTTVYL